MKHPSGDWRRVLMLSGFLIAFAAAFFRLPYHFPVPPSASASYVFQYSNRVAVLIFLAGAIGFAILSRGLSLKPASADSHVSHTYGLIAACTCVAVGVVDSWLTSVNGLLDEQMYFYSRLCQLAAGKTIYRDFEFAYGPLMLYLPFWTSKLLHLSLFHGYVVFWLVDWAVGIWMLFYLVNAIEIASPYRTVVFFLFVVDLAQGLWRQGINYAPVRLLAAATLAMLVYRLHKHHYSVPVVATAAVLGAAIATALSPEHGIAFMLGTGLFFVLCVRQRPSNYWPSMAAMGLAFALIVAIFARMGAFATIRSFSTGGMNYPILPYPGVLCVMGLLLVAACVAYQAFQRKQTDSLTVYLLCICLFSLPSSFGRADPGHMQVGAISAVIIAALALSRYPRISLVAGLAFLYWAAAFQFRGDSTAVREMAERRWFDPSQRINALYQPTAGVFHMLHLDPHLKSIEDKEARNDRNRLIGPPLPDGTIVDAPLGFTRRGFVDDSGKVDYGYFFGTQDAIVPAQVDSIIQWLQTHPERGLVLPNGWQSRCYSFSDGDDPSFRTWYGIHWASPKRRMEVLYPLCDFINANYAPDNTPDSGQVHLWYPINAHTHRSNSAAATGR